MSLRVLICPDKFKGSLSSLDAGRAIQQGFRQVWRGADCRVQALADGGEGFSTIVAKATGARTIQVRTVDAAGRPLKAAYGWDEAHRVAVVELAAASGLARLPGNLRDPAATSTLGTGHLLADALERGARRIILGLGGSATNDAGTGIARALGWRFLDARGGELPPGCLPLSSLAKIVPPPPKRLRAIRACRFIVACDVTNPLLGPNGCSAVFAPQKGARPELIPALESALARLASLTSMSLAKRSGVGAAGGSAFGMTFFLKATLESGFRIVADAVGLERMIAESSFVATGEGRFDRGSIEGKVVGEVVRICARRKVPCVVFAGSSDWREKRLKNTPCVTIVTEPMRLEDALSHSADLLQLAAARAGRLMDSGMKLSSRSRHRA